MARREQIVGAPDKLNLTVSIFYPANGPSEPIAVGKCAYFTIGVDAGLLATPRWWILFGSGPSMPTIDVASDVAGTACFGPFTGIQEFWPIQGQEYFRIIEAASAKSYIRVYRSSLE